MLAWFSICDSVRVDITLSWSQSLNPAKGKNLNFVRPVNGTMTPTWREYHYQTQLRERAAWPTVVPIVVRSRTGT